MSATAAVADLLRESPQWRRFYRQCCETGALRLRAQAWQFRDEISERHPEGCHGFSLQDIEDALLLIARRVLPKTPAAEWDSEWAAQLCRDALARQAEHYAHLTSVQKEALELTAEADWLERMHAASVANNPAAFRVALRGWERAAGEALEAARRGAA